MANVPSPGELDTIARTASDYWDILSRIVPIAVVGGVVAMVVNILRIAYERTWMRRLLALVSVVSVGCVSAGAAALGLKLFLLTPTPEVELLAGAIAGSSGQKIFDIYARKLFGLRSIISDEGIISEQCPPVACEPIGEPTGEPTGEVDSTPQRSLR